MKALDVSSFQVKAVWPVSITRRPLRHFTWLGLNAPMKRPVKLVNACDACGAFTERSRLSVCSDCGEHVCCFDYIGPRCLACDLRYVYNR